MPDPRTSLPQHVVQFCAMFPPSARLCQFRNCKTSTMLTVYGLSLDRNFAPYAHVGNGSGSGYSPEFETRYWLITPYGNGQAIIAVPEDGSWAVRYLTASPKEDEVTLSPFPAAWIISPMGHLTDKLHVRTRIDEEWQCVISWPNLTIGGDSHARVLDIIDDFREEGSGHIHLDMPTGILPFKKETQSQYWVVEFIALTQGTERHPIPPILPHSTPTAHSLVEPEHPPCGCNRCPGHGCIPSHIDSNIPTFAAQPLQSPGHADLRNKCPEVWNQGQMGTCTAHAVAAAFEFDVIKQGLPAFSPSRLFIYYHARAMDGPDARKAVIKDCGSSIRNAIASIDPNHRGVCAEEDWDYEEWESDKTTHEFKPGARASVKPPTISYRHASKHTATKYWMFDSKEQALIKDLENCLDQGYPFIICMKTYGLLNDPEVKKGTLRMPTPQEVIQKEEGLHAVLGVGYDTKQRHFIVRNSWGAQWGDRGYFTMPYEYATSHCLEFWTIRVVTGDSESKPVTPDILWVTDLSQVMECDPDLRHRVQECFY